MQSVIVDEMMMMMMMILSVARKTLANSSGNINIEMKGEIDMTN